ncbi:hypothetical protein MferCBS49748_002998 [Microsporum ferrugineum]
MVAAHIKPQSLDELQQEKGNETSVAYRFISLLNRITDFPMWATHKLRFAKGRSPIFSLGDDEVSYIISVLPPLDAAAFVLSCKFMWQTGKGRSVLQQLYNLHKGRIEILERLEVDFPKHVLCYRCEKFHRRSKIPPPKLEPYGCDTESEIHFLGSPSTESGIQPHLTYRQAKEIMNHYRFGPTHGRPATKVTHYHTFADRGYEGSVHVKIAWNFDVKLIDGNLVLKQDMWATYQVNNSTSRYKAVDICEQGNNHLLHGISANNIGIPLHQCYRCPHSSSERELQVTYIKHKPGYALLRSTLWENLGTCQNPSSGSGLWSHATWSSPCIFSATAIHPDGLKYKHHFNTELPNRDYRGAKYSFW